MYIPDSLSTPICEEYTVLSKLVCLLGPPYLDLYVTK